MYEFLKIIRPSSRPSKAPSNRPTVIPSAAQNSGNSNNDNLNDGQIAGIVIAVFAAVSLFILMYSYRSRLLKLHAGNINDLGSGVIENEKYSVQNPLLS